ncbi:MAG: trigger factor [Nitrospirota bacterium]
MLQKVEELSPTTRKLQINVPTEVIQSETASLYNELKVSTKIPGFRQGKVPQALLIKKFGKNVEAQVIEKVVPQFYMEAIKEAKLEPVSYPNIDDKIEIKQGEPLSFSVTVEIKPDMGELNYDGITLKEKTFSVEDSEIDKAVESMRENKALFTVTDDALDNGDMAIVNNEAFIDYQLKEEMCYKDYPYIVGSQDMPEEFGKALVGKKKGETAEVKISFEDDHPNNTVAGKEVQFKISVTETKKKNLPPVDDEFAKEAECENVEALKNKIRDGLSERKKSGINLDYKKEILNELIKRHAFDVPDSMVKGEIESMLEQAKQNAMRIGQDVPPDEELSKESEPVARENVKSVLLLEAIGKKENIEVNDADVKGAVNEIAARNNMKPEELMKLYTVREGSLDAMKSRLFADKVMDFLLEKATIES